ncbi:UNVERIFIED_CONTAM: hypothetical protein GTU68_051806, partial [Idotea baltica]|nr:hypothetical protein [Idotea baltica]
QSLKSRGFVEQNFAWRHYYWRLTNEGIQYLRDYLHLPAEIVPATLKKPTRPEGRPRAMASRSEGQKSEGSRETYRRAPGGGMGGSDKTGDAGAGSAPMQFVSLVKFLFIRMAGEEVVWYINCVLRRFEECKLHF